MVMSVSSMLFRHPCMRAWTRRTLWACCSPCGPSTGVFNGHRLADSIAADLTTAVRSIGSLAYSHRSRCRRSEACASGAPMATRMRDHSGPGHGVMVHAVATPVHGRSSVPCHSMSHEASAGLFSAPLCIDATLRLRWPSHSTSSQGARYMALLDCMAVIKSFFFLRSISPSPPRLVRFLALVALAPPLDAVPFRCSSATVALIFWRCTTALGRNNSSALALCYV